MFGIFYVFLFGFLTGMTSYAFFLEDEPKNIEDMVRDYEKSCKNDMLKIYQDRLKQD
jgi:hypothetical protein